MRPDLIFCGGGAPVFTGIAIESGFLYGARLPSSTYAPLYFADQNWKKPDRASYMRALEKERPTIASVLDWEREDQLSEVLSWAEEAARFVKIIMIIPKVSGISSLPHYIGGAEVRLGYSVPTKHGGTSLHVAEFMSRSVHLLGGSPGAQMRLSQYMDVKSADGNMSLKMANRGLYWIKGKKTFSNDWVSLREIDGKKWDGNGNHEAFRRSCINIVKAWENL